jgi:hypothetical protein
MSSFSGRVSSAQMLRLQRRKSSAIKRIQEERKKNSKSSIHSIDENPHTFAPQDNNISSKEEETFKILTKNVLNDLNASRTRKMAKLKAIQCSKKNNSEKLVNGEIVYEGNDENDAETRDLKEILSLGRDESLHDGNPLPMRFGTPPKQVVHKPIIELDPYLNLTDEVFYFYGFL